MPDRGMKSMCPWCGGEPVHVVWRPIATAPKNGTEILGFVPSTGRLVLQWNAVAFSATMKSEWLDTTEGMPWEPTHWLPLPEGPKGE